MRTQEIFLTASLGVAGYREKGQTAEDLLKDAAIALYEAKRRGKDTIEFFRTSMRDDRSELVALEAELRRALERNEIEVVYQPIARLADMDLAGFEALMRWRHRTFGLLGPESFLTVAETTGMIKDLGRFVLNDAARNLGIWQRAFRAKQPLFVAVNVSSSQLIGTDLVDEVKAILAREGIQRDTPQDRDHRIDGDAEPGIGGASARPPEADGRRPCLRRFRNRLFLALQSPPPALRYAEGRSQFHRARRQ